MNIITVATRTLQAEKKILDAGYNKEYLPIEGLDAFRAATVQLLLGSDHPAIKEVRLYRVLENGRGGGRLMEVVWGWGMHCSFAPPLHNSYMQTR
jgi:aspartate/tyrosine/aromatic aminotransferase